MTLCFAYGANMDRADMRRRCPDATPLGPARLDGWRFVMTRDGYASIIRQGGGVVHGVLWQVPPRALAALDAFEGVSFGLYRRTTLTVRRGARSRRALVYVGRRSPAGRPVRGYLEQVMAAAGAWALPAAYRQQLARWRRSGPIMDFSS
ncbi:MAG: gamma-glutamylcyclotransferase [Rhizobiales bacterium]|nr:gamma-glutamylcyclotransferase [Hyphomicrobiales bacterium]OJY42487.1 MAG: hypothetical protein BGP08_18515 [Rhizobiales bacterium 64-17]